MIKFFLDDLSSSSPTPGGGASAALCGAFSASLVEMVCNLTIGKKGYEGVENKMKEIKRNVVKEKEKLLLLIEEDVKAFDEVMKAYGLPKETEGRSTKILKALKKATEVPLNVAKISKEIERMAEIMVKKCNKNAYSDAKSALYIAKASYKSALENVKINLNYITDRKYVKSVKKIQKKFDLY